MFFVWTGSPSCIAGLSLYLVAYLLTASQAGILNPGAEVSLGCIEVGTPLLLTSISKITKPLWSKFAIPKACIDAR